MEFYPIDQDILDRIKFRKRTNQKMLGNVTIHQDDDGNEYYSSDYFDFVKIHNAENDQYYYQDCIKNLQVFISVYNSMDRDNFYSLGEIISAKIHCRKLRFKITGLIESDGKIIFPQINSDNPLFLFFLDANTDLILTIKFNCGLQIISDMYLEIQYDRGYINTNDKQLIMDKMIFNFDPIISVEPKIIEKISFYGSRNIYEPYCSIYDIEWYVFDNHFNIQNNTAFFIHYINKKSGKHTRYDINDIKQFTEDNPLNIKRSFFIGIANVFNVRIKYTRKLHDSTELIESTEN